MVGANSEDFGWAKSFYEIGDTILNSNSNQHLEMPELAKLLELARQTPGVELRPAEVHPHLAACGACREQFEGLARLDRQIARMEKTAPAEAGAECPDAGVWTELAGGLIEPDETLQYIDHASRCDQCGPRLRAAVGELVDLNGPLTDEERSQIANLDSSRPEWQLRLAARISGTPNVDPQRASIRQRFWWFPKMAAAGAAVVLVVAAVGWWATSERGTAASANQQLARAYTDQRTLELRLPGASYAPLRVQRGPASSFVARPPALLKAEAVIAGQLAAHPNDPAWLQAAARADVLEGKYDAAVESLQRALELQPHAPEVLADLGTAYFQRAQSEDRPEDFGAAFEFLSQVLVQQPDNTVALFNRAIVAEHQFLYRQALEDWDHYLKLDTSSEWASEARNRAEAVRAKLKEHGGVSRPLLSPADLGPGTMATEVDQRVEEYLREAIRSWLPEAYPESPSRAADPSAQRALFLLADLTSRQHEDRWLSDLLRGISAPHFRQAVAALSRSLAANDLGDYGTSTEQAVIAEQLFRASSNSAGALRAQFEQVFSAQLTRRNEQCREKASTVLADTDRFPYSWLHIQLRLEKSVCAGVMGDLGAQDKIGSQALEEARKTGYGAAYLRAVGFVADDEFRSGNFPGAWKLIAKGMERYWSGQYVPVRAYLLCNILGSYVDSVQQPNLKVAIWQEAVSLIDADEDLAMRAGAHNSLANAATAAHQLPLAEAQYTQAAQLFALAPRTGASLASALDNEIRSAQLEARQGHFDEAVARLTRNQGQIRQLSDNYLALMFYAALGELQLRNHQEASAEQSLRPALALAEKNLASLNTEADRLKWGKDAAPVYLAMAEAELVQGRVQESLAVYEWYLAAAERGGRGPGKTAPAGEPDATWLTSRLPLLGQETVIVYGVLPDGLAIWTYDDRGVNGQWRPEPTRELVETAQRFYESCSDPDSELSAVRRDARSLYTSLIAPIEQRLQSGRTLVIEANGWARRVPFESLLDASDHYLIERGPIVHSLGQYSDAQAHSVGLITSAQRALVVGSTASSQAKDLIPLPNVVAEAEMVAADFPSAVVLKGREATMDAVVAALPEAGVFHFTGHSLAVSQHAGLLLTGAGSAKGTPLLLEGDKLRRLNLRTLQLAVLSTCSTESGSDGSRGFNSVAEALERAGVPHVVASRWAVDSVETRKFMESFYRSLLSGQPVSNALRLTAQAMLSNPRTSHPYFWSAFAAYGQP